MPIDPRKFEKIITNHFKNLTEEEFLKTLQKSSPYLFDESLETEQNKNSNKSQNHHIILAKNTTTSSEIEVIDESQSINH